MNGEEEKKVVIDPFTGQPRVIIEKKEVKVERRAGGGGGSSAAAITIKDEGTTLTATPSSMDFVGTGVTATASGNDVTVTVSGGGSGSPGGNDTEVQYNSAGSFGGITNATTDGSVLTLTNPVIGVKDTEFTLKDDSDTTKTVNFDLSFITAGQNRIWTFPNTAGTFVGVTATQTLTNKTLTSPVINTGTAGTSFNPSSNDGATLGDSGTAFSDLYLASGAVIDFAAGNAVLTHSSGILTVSTGDLRVTTAGTNAASAVTNAGTQTLTNKDISSATNTYRAASDTATGAVELATAAETTTGTDATRAVTPDGLAGSDFGVRTIGLLASDPSGSAITTGDGKVYARIPANMNGCNLIGVAASLSTVSSSGAVTVQVRRSRRTNATTRANADMLSTAITIDQSEFDTEDAATPAVINASNDDVVTGDHIYIDIDGAGTGAKGLCVVLRFQLP